VFEAQSQWEKFKVTGRKQAQQRNCSDGEPWLKSRRKLEAVNKHQPIETSYNPEVSAMTLTFEICLHCF